MGSLIPPDVAALGALLGLGYGLVAVGLVLCFRASRVLNLAHGQVGALAAVMLALAVDRWDVPYWTAFAPALAVGALLSAGVELTVIRRLRAMPPVVTVVATLGVAQLLLHLTGALAGELTTGSAVPQPPGVPSFEIGVLVVTPAQTALLVLGPIAVAALVAVLRAPVLGKALRASADNPSGARLLGIPARALAALSWGFAGALAALTVVLLLPGGAAPATMVLGPSLLLRALAAAVLARMWRLPVALGAGVAIGVLEQLAMWHLEVPGLPDLLLLFVILAALAARGDLSRHVMSDGSWSAFERWSPLPAAARAVPLVRAMAPATAGAALLAAALVPLVADAPTELRLAALACTAIAALSVWLLAGLAGILSLGQFGLAAVGAVVAAAVGKATGSPLAGLAAAPPAAAVVGTAVGAVGLRSGVFGGAVATLGLAIAVEGWLLDGAKALGTGVTVEKLDLGFGSLHEPAVGYLTAVAMLAACLFAASWLARGRLARRLVASRDNESTAEAFAVPVRRVRLQALALAGALAGLAGGLTAQVLFRLTPGAFPVSLSIEVVAAALVGGLAVSWGPVAGALYIVALPALVDLPSAALAATAFGWLLLLLYLPGGLASAVLPIRGAVARSLLRLAGHDPVVLQPAPRVAAVPTGSPGALAESVQPQPPGSLSVVDLSRSYGAISALDGVSLAFAAGSITAVVGPNGAGKTTLLSLAAGADTPDAGAVRLDGVDVTALDAAARTRRGVVRSFQDGRLFATMTVEDCVRLALDAHDDPDADRARRLLSAVGLEPFAEARVRELSTGTRRVAELTCLVALRPRVLLLDEPSAGLAHPEVDALCSVLGRLRELLGVTLVIVEHDLDLVERLADRVVVMRTGRVVADGTPANALAGALA